MIKIATLTASAALATTIAFSAVAKPALTACDASVNVFSPNYDACVGAISGNDTGATGTAEDILNNNDVFGADDWMFLGKDDGLGNAYFEIFNDTLTGSGIGEGSGTVVFDVDAINDAFGPDFLTQYDVAISFKASNAYSLYAWYAPIWEDNPSQAPNIDWEVSTASNDPDLSHGSIWYRKGDTTVSEPSTFALFGLGLLGLALVKRTKNHA